MISNRLFVGKNSQGRRASAQLITPSDISVAFGLGVLLFVSWLLPARFWPSFCRLVSPLVVRSVTADPDSVVKKIAKALNCGTLAQASAILRQLAGEHVLMLLQLLRDYRPGGWNPEIRIEGAEHVKQALAQGRGAILWIGYTFQADLVAKLAFRRAGLRVRHLSRPSHGFSTTRFGTHFLNRVQTRIEDRQIDKRIILDPADPKPAIAALAAHLADNGVVSITARHDANRPVKIDFGGGCTELAPGAAVLSLKTGAALLPAFAFRDLQGHLRLTIHPPLRAPPDTPRHTDVNMLAARYGELLRRFLRRYPSQWVGWIHL